LQLELLLFSPGIHKSYIQSHICGSTTIENVDSSELPASSEVMLYYIELI